MTEVFLSHIAAVGLLKVSRQ